MKRTNQNKIAFFGSGGIFSNTVLKQIIQESVTVSFVVILVKPDSNLTPLNEGVCVQYKIPYVITDNVNTLAIINILQEHSITLGVIASFSQILKTDLIRALTDGLINLHPSYLPYYRGANPVFWQIKALKDEFGVSVHKVTQGIDEGSILAQEKVIMREAETGNNILNKLAQLGSELLVEILRHYEKYGELIEGGSSEVKIEGFYNQKPKHEDFKVDLLSLSYLSLKKLLIGLKKWGDIYFVYDDKEYIIDEIDQDVTNIVESHNAPSFEMIENTAHIRNLEESFIVRVKVNLTD